MAVFDNATVVWRRISRAPREYPHQKLESLGYIFAADNVGLYLHSNFRGGWLQIHYQPAIKQVFFRAPCVQSKVHQSGTIFFNIYMDVI